MKARGSLQRRGETRLRGEPPGRRHVGPPHARSRPPVRRSARRAGRRASSSIGSVDVRRRRRRRRRVGTGGRRRGRAGRAAVVLRLRRPLAPARRRPRRRPVRLARRPHGRVGDRPGRGRARSRSSSAAAFGSRAASPCSPASPAPRPTPPLLAWSEARYERAIFLDLTVLELRFERITDTRPIVKGSDPSTLQTGDAEPQALLAGQTPALVRGRGRGPGRRWRRGR